MRIYKVEEWQGALGHWHVGDQSDLAHNSNLWYIPPRLLGLSLEEWIFKLKNEFNATGFKFYPDANDGKSLLTFYWVNYADCHKYVLWINKQARNNHWAFQ